MKMTTMTMMLMVIMKISTAGLPGRRFSYGSTMLIAMAMVMIITIMMAILVIIKMCGIGLSRWR